MGSSSSKDASAGIGRSRTRVFQSSCLGRGPSAADDSNQHHLIEEVLRRNKEEKMSLSQAHHHHDHHHLLNNNDVKLDSPSSSSSSTTRLLDGSRFSFIPANLSFRLSKTASFGSSSRPTHQNNNNNNSDALTTIPNTSDHLHISSDPSPRPYIAAIVSNQVGHVTISNENIPTSSNENPEINFVQSRQSNRRIGAREPVERSVRFSRTLSVGRLRDRVLRRPSFTDGLFGHLHQDREVRSSQENNMPDSDGNAYVSPPPSTLPLSHTSTSMYSGQDDELETSSRPREARYHDIMEHRTDFLERRRRIRSQVRALQRLGNRFENLSGHERSCILAGQHRSGGCTCQTSNRSRNPDDDTSARASISRIVMLAEALFEVLDEIHQQSVVLSSRPSVSSLGSITAPKEVVESMPVKIYTKLQHSLEDIAQCYICLVEYEDGDCMRILPCHHEFHSTCIDKWLKEIHRVCPLCRGDVCRFDSLSPEI